MKFFLIFLSISTFSFAQNADRKYISHELKSDEINIKVNQQTVVTVVAVSGGYPGNYQAGKSISGLTDAAIQGSMIFHSGTIQEGNEVMSNGGRVLTVTSYGDNIQDAAGQSMYVMENIFFDGIYYRDDIGYEFVQTTPRE